MRCARGFNLIELALVSAVLAVVSMSLASGVGVSASATRTLDDRSRVDQQGQMYLERLNAIPFGDNVVSAASAGDVSELFDADELFGVATLHSLREFGPIEFALTDMAMPGSWRIVVERDLNGDGDMGDSEEGRYDLLRCAVSYEGRLVGELIRFDPKGTP